MSSTLNSIARCGLCVWLCVMPGVLAGQNAFSPGGEAYKIAGALVGDQTHPQAAISASGGFLVWQDNAVDGDGLGIKAQRLNANLVKSGQAFRVNQQGAHDQEKPQVALLNDGGAVVVWQGGRYGFQKIYARFLNPDGSFRTGDILVNTYTNEFQIDPAVATLADGSVVVVWSSFGQDPFSEPMQGVYAQRFSVEGVKMGDEFRVNQWVRYNQRTPSVAALANGHFVVTWISELQRASASVDVYARIFDAAGEPVGGEFAVNPSTTNMCANPSVATSPQGGFAVAWSQYDGVVRAGAGEFAASQRSTNSWDVFGRLYNANGVAAGGPVRLNTHTFGDQFAPKISAFGKDFLSVWTSLGQDDSWEGVFGQFLTGGGALTGIEFRVNTTTVSRQVHPSVATDGVNRFLVLWSSFGAGTSFDLFARAYDLIRIEVTPSGQGVTVSWNTQPGMTYQLQKSSAQGGWVDVGGPRVAFGHGDSVTVEATNATAFYRVIRVQ